MGRFGRIAISFLVLNAGIFALRSLRAQDGASQNYNPSQTGGCDQQDNEQQVECQRQALHRLERPLPVPYKTWLIQDVVYIITSEERDAFVRLTTDEEREQFIEQFWLRRDPTPDAPENEFEEEHYRRIAYANAHFAFSIPGWKTDRGRFYIMWGPPDKIESSPNGPEHWREGGTGTLPLERWTYRHMDAFGNDLILNFVETAPSGEYDLSGCDDEERNPDDHTPDANRDTCEDMAPPIGSVRFTRGETPAPVPPALDRQREEEFWRIVDFANTTNTQPGISSGQNEAVGSETPAAGVTFPDLAHEQGDAIKFQLRFDFMRATTGTTLVPITVEIQKNSGAPTAPILLLGRITTLDLRPVQLFEDEIHPGFQSTALGSPSVGNSIFQKTVPLRTGVYSVAVAIEDVNANEGARIINFRLTVPAYEDNTLGASSLIVTDYVQPATTNQGGAGRFVFGDTAVQPEFEESFTEGQPLGVYLQLYNFKVDEETHRNDVAITARVSKDERDVKSIAWTGDELHQRGDEITIQDADTLNGLEPGRYHLEIQAVDHISKQTVTRETDFAVVAAGASAAAK